MARLQPEHLELEVVRSGAVGWWVATGKGRGGSKCVFDLFVHHYSHLFTNIVVYCSPSGSSIFDGGLFTKSMEVALFMGGV